MKIFLSWSGDRSKRVATLLAEWLPTLINQIDPWISSRDIPSGSSWLAQINAQLASRTFGIACLTRENKQSPWILFECGALAKGLEESRIYLLCIDLKTTDIERPLGSFNGVEVTEEGLRKLIFDINRELEQPLKETILDRAFSNGWPNFNVDFTNALAETEEAECPPQKPDTTAQISEVLERVRQMDKRLEESTNSAVNPQIDKSSLNAARNFRSTQSWQEVFTVKAIDLRNGSASTRVLVDTVKSNFADLYTSHRTADGVSREIYFKRRLSSTEQDDFEQIISGSG